MTAADLRGFKLAVSDSWCYACSNPVEDGKGHDSQCYEVERDAALESGARAIERWEALKKRIRDNDFPVLVLEWMHEIETKER